MRGADNQMEVEMTRNSFGLVGGLKNIVVLIINEASLNKSQFRDLF